MGTKLKAPSRRVIHETPTLRCENKFWKGLVIQYGKEIFTQSETWRLLKDGDESKKLLSEPYLVAGKNHGRSNATEPKEQAILEIESDLRKKIDKGYVAPGQKSAILPLPMLAHKFADRRHTLTFPAYVQPKYNGMRMLYDGKKAWSRGGKLMIPAVIEHLQFDTEGYIMDGELILRDMPLLQETMKAAKKYRKGISDKLVYVVYDIVDPTLTFEERFQIFNRIVARADNFDILPAPTYSVEEHEIAHRHIEFINAKYEGTMIRSKIGKYMINKRSADLLKLKDFQDSEYKIVDVIDGGGKDAGHAIFVCETKKGRPFNCRPEGTMESRAEMFKNRKKYIGQWLTVRYFELTKDEVPQFPVGVCVRETGEF